MKFRLLTNDVDRGRAYSGLADITAPSIDTAKVKARRRLWAGEKGILVPVDKLDQLPRGGVLLTERILLAVAGSSRVAPVFQKGAK